MRGVEGAATLAETLADKCIRRCSVRVASSSLAPSGPTVPRQYPFSHLPMGRLIGMFVLCPLSEETGGAGPKGDKASLLRKWETSRVNMYIKTKY